MTAAIDHASIGRRSAAKSDTGVRAPGTDGRAFTAALPPQPMLMPVPECEPPLEIVDGHEPPAPLRGRVRAPLTLATGSRRILSAPPDTPRRSVAAPERHSRLLVRRLASPFGTSPAPSAAPGDEVEPASSDDPATRRIAEREPAASARVRGGLTRRSAAPAPTSWVTPINITRPPEPEPDPADDDADGDHDTPPMPVAAGVDAAAPPLPSLESAAASIAQGLVEIMTGRRDMTQLRRHCTEEVYRAIGDVPTMRSRHRPMLVSIHSDQSTPEVGEIAASFTCSGRVRALAFRLEGADGHWALTDVHIG